MQYINYGLIIVYNGGNISDNGVVSVINMYTVQTIRHNY